MKDKIVTVYRGGPESKKGKLTAVKSDYIALQAEKNNLLSVGACEKYYWGYQ